jgi:hypothetical protein
MKRACIIIFPCLANVLAFAQLELPWHFADAANRTVFRVTTSHDIFNSVITLPQTPDSSPLVCVDAFAPDTRLPLYPGTNGASLLLPGKLTVATPRYVIAYRGSLVHSPLLTAFPQASDFSQSVLHRSWDFDDGTPCGITSWGNGPSHLGPITVKNGWLQVPVKDNDPYLIFGEMFSPPDPARSLRIESAAYRYLEMRIRQSCPNAEWEFFVTDQNGRYKSSKFTVKGTVAQTVRFDLRTTFPDFWDGRLFRAFRLDTTNDRKDILAEIDFIRLLPEPPTVTAGPTFTREAVTTRALISGYSHTLPSTLSAGSNSTAKVNIAGLPPESPVIWSFTTPDVHVALEGSASSILLPALTHAGVCTYRLGIADDLGEPLHAVTGTVLVKPAPLLSYHLQPSHAFIDFASPTATFSIFGLDRYGNPLPVDIPHPQWIGSGQIRFPEGRLAGAPASAQAICLSETPMPHLITLTDRQGHSGTTTVTTVAYRKETVRLAPSGYLVTPAGTLFFPAGGLYANWPHHLNSDHTISRSLDLFPCGPTPYKAGFPWDPQTEAAVAAYLGHCSDRGINCLRLMLRNMDLVGRVDPLQLQAVLHLFGLARPYGIRFNVALFEDYEKPPYVSPEVLEKIVLPKYTLKQLANLPSHQARFLLRKELLTSASQRYSDPDAIACQKDYLSALIPVLAAREEVLCYELENEMVFPPMIWCRTIARFIRTIDPHTLILGNPGPHDWPEPLRWRESGCDLFSYHPYTDGQPPADHGAIIYLRSKFAAQSQLAMYTGEGGLNQNRWQKGVKQVKQEASARGARDQIWMSVCCGANGCLYWTLTHDLEAQEFATLSIALQVLGLDFLTLKRQRPTVAITLSPKERNHRDAALAMRLLDLGVDFDTVAKSEAAAYSVRVDPDVQTPEMLALPPTVAAPGPGWQIATLLSEDNRQALLYFRNIAGGVHNVGAPPRPCTIRDVQPKEAVFKLRSRWRTITVLDLDTRKTVTVNPEKSGQASLGVTSHDFLIALRQ